MKKLILRVAASVLCVVLLAANFAGCQNVTPPTSSSASTSAQQGASSSEPITDEDFTLKESDAQSLVDEKLPDGYTSEKSGTAEIADDAGTVHNYYIFSVKDANGAEVGEMAVDTESGERMNYAGEGEVTEYSDFPLYDTTTDAECDWNGIWKNDSASVELMQEDNTTFSFAFSDGTENVARIKGNTAATDAGDITFTYGEDGSLLVGGENSTLSGTYTK